LFLANPAFARDRWFQISAELSLRFRWSRRRNGVAPDMDTRMPDKSICEPPGTLGWSPRLMLELHQL